MFKIYLIPLLKYKMSVVLYSVIHILFYLTSILFFCLCDIGQFSRVVDKLTGEVLTNYPQPLPTSRRVSGCRFRSALSSKTFNYYYYYFLLKPVTLLCSSDTHRGELVVPAATPYARGVSNYWVRKSCALSRRNGPRMIAFCILPAKISAEFRHAGMIFSSESSMCLILPRVPVISYYLDSMINTTT